MAPEGWEAVIGMEVHVQLATRSKMFCGCSTDYEGAPPNTHVCPVCLGMPGVLPTINRQGVEEVLKTALALGGEIPRHSKFDRKNYFYPDLPKGYQISQYDLPMSTGGELEIRPGRRIRITRVHLEEDTGKLTHAGDQLDLASESLVDLNRSGMPLMEVVSEPELRSADDCRDYAMALREILRYIGASEADMEKGQLRAEANVSVRRTGSAEFGVKTELKNINSFRALHRAVAHEIERQVRVLESGGAVVQETRGWSEQRQETFSQRSKEFAQDYRYFPEPDLPPLELDPAWIARLRAELPELPAARRARLMASPHAGGYGLTEYMARRLVTDREIADYYELVMAETGEPVDTSFNQAVANWLLEDFVPIWQQQDLGQPSRALSPPQMANLFGLLHSRRVSHEKARELMKLVWGTLNVPEEVARERGFEAIDNPASLAFFADLAIDSKRQAARDFLSGKQEAFGVLMQELRTQSEGKADMRAAGQVLRDRLATRRDELL